MKVKWIQTFCNPQGLTQKGATGPFCQPGSPRGWEGESTQSGGPQEDNTLCTFSFFLKYETQGRVENARPQKFLLRAFLLENCQPETRNPKRWPRSTCPSTSGPCRKRMTDRITGIKNNTASLNTHLEAQQKSWGNSSKTELWPPKQSPGSGHANNTTEGPQVCTAVSYKSLCHASNIGLICKVNFIIFQRNITIACFSAWFNIAPPHLIHMYAACLLSGCFLTWKNNFVRLVSSLKFCWIIQFYLHNSNVFCSGQFLRILREFTSAAQVCIVVVGKVLGKVSSKYARFPNSKYRWILLNSK